MFLQSAQYNYSNHWARWDGLRSLGYEPEILMQCKRFKHGDDGYYDRRQQDEAVSSAVFQIHNT